MTDLAAFPIHRKWPAQHPDRIQLYSLPTPNGVKVSALLEETGLPYEPHLVRFDADDQLSAEFRSKHVARVLEVFLARPAIVRALNIPARPNGQPK